VTREFIRGQLAYMTTTRIGKIGWGNLSDEFICGWLASHDNDQRMGEVEGAPV